MPGSLATPLSLAPGFSPVLAGGRRAAAVSTAFSAGWEAAEAAEMIWASRITGLKPGANEKKTSSNDFENTP